jgi:hypothetical protein
MMAVMPFPGLSLGGGCIYACVAGTLVACAWTVLLVDTLTCYRITFVYLSYNRSVSWTCGGFDEPAMPTRDGARAGIYHLEGQRDMSEDCRS